MTDQPAMPGTAPDDEHDQGGWDWEPSREWMAALLGRPLTPSA